MLAPEDGGDCVEIGHLADVQPAARHGNDDVGAAEAQRLQQRHALVGVGDVLAHEIFAGDADVRAPAAQRRDDLGRGDECDVDAVDAFDLAAIAAVVADLAQLQPRLTEELGRLLHQPSLRRHGECQARAHRLLPRTTASRRSV